MGRSGGGHRAGGGGGFHSHGGYHHHGGYHGGGFHHHYYYGGGGGGPFSTLACCMVMIPVTFFLTVVFIVVVLVSEVSTVAKTDLSPCEQMVVCPGELRDDVVEFSAGSSVATLHYSLPHISTTTNETRLTVSSKYIWSSDYYYWSFNLVAGSTLKYNLKGSYSDYFDFYLLKGYNNFRDFDSGYSFNYEKKSYGISTASGTYQATATDEYFVIIEADYYSIYVSGDFDVFHTRYLTEENSEQRCEGSCNIEIPEAQQSNACIIVEKSCDTTSTETVKVTYYQPFSGVFYGCLVCAGIIGVVFVACVVACIFCACRGQKGASGQTYNNVPSSAAVDPSYPAGNPTPSYQQPPTYNPVPPAYSSADPAAPAYVPYGAPASYGTAPATTY